MPASIKPQPASILGVMASLKIALSTRAETTYTAPLFAPGDAFLFGPETRGLPAEILDSLPPQQRLRLPMQAQSRSLNCHR